MKRGEDAVNATEPVVAASAAPPLSAIVLAGGRGSRLGTDKATAVVGGSTLVDAVVAAARTVTSEIIVAGPATAVPIGCIGVREEPAFSGPLAALEAALPHVTADRVLVLACDLVRPAAVVALLTAANARAEDALVLRDPNGRAQWLAGNYDVAALRRAFAGLVGETADRPIRAVTAELDIQWLDADTATTADIDTPADLAAARELHASTSQHRSEE